VVRARRQQTLLRNHHDILLERAATRRASMEQLGNLALTLGPAALVLLVPSQQRPPRAGDIDWARINALLAHLVLAYVTSGMLFRTCSFEHVRPFEWLSYIAGVAMCGATIVLGLADLGPAVTLALLYSARRFWRVNIRGPQVLPAHCMNMRSKVCIVTGGNSGIGVETARGLAEKGATVVIAARNLEKATDAARDIIRTTGNNQVFIEPFDAESFDSVRRFAERVGQKYPAVHVLVHNAGVMLPVLQKSEHGLERMLHTNFLSVFLLTALLGKQLRAAAGARVVCVSSSMAKWTCVVHPGGFDHTLDPGTFQMFHTYGQSKLAVNLFVHELNRRMMKGANMFCTINSCHPGTMMTGITRDLAYWLRKGQICIRAMIKSAPEGSMTSRFLAMSPRVQSVSGKFFEHCAVAPLPRGNSDPASARKLWKWAEKELGISADELLGLKPEQD
jgi:NAD(P)-dependent dehydrogenase (short-subunit alcohol dehydrogenase family)